MNRNEKNVNKLTMLGMMTALVFVSNYLRITMPIAIGGRTSFTLANIMCCLSGLLLGPVGGFASGLGSAIYDLTNPAYAPECWITFLTKGVMGMVAGLAMKDRETPAYGRCTVSAALGCVAYYILYFFKSFAYDGLLMGGLTAAVAAPVLCEGDVLGAVLFVTDTGRLAGDTECKLAQTVAAFLGKSMES